jgi:hypothetical protein
MNTCKTEHEAVARVVWLALAPLLMLPFGSKAGMEETFPLLQIGTRTYTNVTVTSKAKTYIFLIHAGGMNNIKIADLPADLRERLGYNTGAKPKTGTNSPAAWAKAEVAKLETPQIKEVREKLEQRWKGNKSAALPLTALLTSKVFLAMMGILLLVYLFHCYCFMLICEKAGQSGGPLVWLPVLRFFPLLRAAGMSGWWFLAYLLPLFNIVAFILWSVNIAKARGKSGLVALFLILPPTYFFAILYLAFSSGAGTDDEDREPEVMSLQAA